MSGNWAGQVKPNPPATSCRESVIRSVNGVSAGSVPAVFRSIEVQVAYAIGKASPVGLFVETFGTEQVDPDKIAEAIKQVFDLRPAAIIRDLDLLRPIYRTTAAYGHFGRPQGSNWLLDADDAADRTAVGPTFTWEATDRVEELKVAAGR